MLTTQYRWNDTSSIQRIDVRKFKSGLYEAYIYAPPAAPAGALQEMPGILKQSGYEAISDNVAGQNVLRVTGFTNEDELFNALNRASYLQGPPRKQEVGSKERIPISKKLRQESVKMSGIMGMLGHAAMAVSGVLEKKPALIATSLFYGASTSLPALKGAGNSGEYQELVRSMKDHLKHEGVEIPQGKELSAEELSKEGGVVEKLKGFVDKYPLQISNAIGSLGNVVLMSASIHQSRKDPNQSLDAGRIAGGLASLVAGLSIALIPEKAPEKPNPANCVWPGSQNDDTAPENVICVDKDEIKDQKGLSPKRFVNWVREKPMQFAGAMFFASNAAFGYQGYQMSKAMKAKQGRLASGEVMGEDASALQDEINSDKTALRFAYTTSAAYFLASTFTSISSKNPVSDYNEQELLTKLCAYSANLISEMPQDIRDEAITKMAEHLAEQPKVLETKDEIVTIINDKVDKISQGPWVGKVTMEEMPARQAGPGANLNA